MRGASSCPHGARCSRENQTDRKKKAQEERVLWIIAVVLLILWAVGYFIVHIGDIIHALVVIAVVLVLANVVRGIGSRRAS